MPAAAFARGTVPLRLLVVSTQTLRVLLVPDLLDLFPVDETTFEDARRQFLEEFKFIGDYEGVRLRSHAPNKRWEPVQAIQATRQTKVESGQK